MTGSIDPVYSDVGRNRAGFSKFVSSSSDKRGRNSFSIVSVSIENIVRVILRVGFAPKEAYVTVFRVVFHDQDKPWYGLHEVEFNDAGKIVWWNRDLACFSSDASDGPDGVAQLLMAAAGDAGRWPALKESELPR